MTNYTRPSTDNINLVYGRTLTGKDRGLYGYFVEMDDGSTKKVLITGYKKDTLTILGKEFPVEWEIV